MNIEDIVKINNFLSNNTVNENMYDNDGNLYSNNQYKTTGIISKILLDWWERYYQKYKTFIDKIRPNADKEVRKVIDCYNHNLGYSFYECPNCGEFLLCEHTCKGKLCPCCGGKRQKIITEHVMQTAYNVTHRQIVFTIPKELRFFFFDDPTSLDILFQSVCETIYSICEGNFSKKKKKKIKKWLPGFFAFLHTFGRSMQWNPHIHVLIAEMKLNDISFQKWNYFNYNALSKRFQVILIKNMEKHFGKKITQIKNQLFINHPNGFYVYAEPKDFKSLKDGIMYVSRYSARAAIGEKRILNYDGNNVTYCYNDHKDNSYHEVTISAFDFITLIIGHLLPENYKSVRYYGFYRTKTKFHDKLIMMISKEKHDIRNSHLKWRALIMLSFSRDPLECPKCHSIMEFQYRVT